MGINVEGVFDGLINYSKVPEERKGRWFDPERQILRRVKTDDGDSLELIKFKKLDLFEKIKVFFGHSDFSLRTVSRIVQTAIENASPAQLEIFEKEKIESVKISCDRLNARIEDRNKRIFTLFIEGLKTERLDRIGVSPEHARVFSLVKPILADSEIETKVAVYAKGIQKTLEMILTNFIEEWQPNQPVDKPKGIRNPGSLCYCNAMIKALFSSPAFRDGLNELQKREALSIREHFLNVCKEIEHGGEPLNYSKDDLQLLHSDLVEIFPRIKNIFAQQDIQELLAPFLDETLDEQLKFFVVPKLVQYEKPKAYEGIILPTLDPLPQEQMTEPTNLVKVTPHEGLNIQEFFSGYKETENIELDGILNSGRNKDLDQSQIDRLLELAGLDYLKGCSREDLRKNHQQEIAKILEVVDVERSHQLQGTPRDFLPVYIPRFGANWMVKNNAPVIAPLYLKIPIEGKDIEVYVLRSVAVHRGGLGGGHYYSYVPESTDIDSGTGMPTRWLEHNDSHVYERKWESIADDVATNGCVFIYDRIKDTDLTESTPM